MKFVSKWCYAVFYWLGTASRNSPTVTEVAGDSLHNHVRISSPVSSVLHWCGGMWERKKKTQPDSSISRRNSGEINIGIKKHCWPFLWEFLCPPHCDIDSKFGRMVVLHQGCTLVSVWKSAGACKTLIPLLITGFVTYIHKSFAPSCMEGATEGSNWVNRGFPPAWPLPPLSRPCPNTDIGTGLLLQSQCSRKGEQRQDLELLSERSGWGDLGWVGWIASGKGLKRKVTI